MEIDRENHAWMERARCRGATRVFFDDVWPADGDFTDTHARRPPVRAALEVARAICAECPVRAQCEAMVLEEESGLPAEERWGVCAGMTPLERAYHDRWVFGAG